MDCKLFQSCVMCVKSCVWVILWKGERLCTDDSSQFGSDVLATVQPGGTCHDPGDTTTVAPVVFNNDFGYIVAASIVGSAIALIGMVLLVLCVLNRNATISLCQCLGRSLMTWICCCRDHPATQLPIDDTESRRRHNDQEGPSLPSHRQSMNSLLPSLSNSTSTTTLNFEDELSAVGTSRATVANETSLAPFDLNLTTVHNTRVAPRRLRMTTVEQRERMARLLVLRREAKQARSAVRAINRK